MNVLPDAFIKQFGEVTTLRLSLNSETDRGCALMVASFIDFKLKQLLTAKFVDDHKVAKRILGTNGPLGSFSSRIDASYMLGLVGVISQRDLHLIREIRNYFSHSHVALSFSDEAISKNCKKLVSFHYLEPTDDPRKMFVKSALAILSQIDSKLLRVIRIPVEPDFSISQDDLVMFKKHVDDVVGALTASQIEVLRKFMLDMLSVVTPGSVGDGGAQPSVD